MTIITSTVITVLVFLFTYSQLSSAASTTESNAVIDTKLLHEMIAATRPGGETSVNSASVNAFSFNSENMSSRRKGDFLVGNDFFEDPWVIAPSSTSVRDGLGPLFNVSSCQSCHVNDGSGHAPIDKNDDVDTLLVRLSTKLSLEAQERLLTETTEPHQGDSIYGSQIQNRAIPGVDPEMQISVDYKETTFEFNDGELVNLRQPIFNFSKTNYGELHNGMVFSPRVANQMIGLGLLEAIDEADIIAESKKQAEHGYVSGVLNTVWDVEKQQFMVGRFGWKAGQPSVKQQVAAAFNGDLGLTSKLFLHDQCQKTQVECLNAPHGNDKHITEAAAKFSNNIEYEIRDDILNFVDFYSRNLAVPVRRNVEDVDVIAGAKLFTQAQCATCHKPNWQTKALDDAHIEQSNQEIWPYTDMLLHDMGEALSDFDKDNKAVSSETKNEYQATVREWRTAPLWGIGLRQTVSSQATFLHDGRARNITEAILWHGGEAENAKQSFANLSKKERQQLIKFVESL